MEKFIPYEKLSKKKKRELDAKGRGTWAIDPAVRKSANPKAYNRRTAQKWRDDEPISVPVFVTIRFSNKTSSFIGIQLIMRKNVRCSDMDLKIRILEYAASLF